MPEDVVHLTSELFKRMQTQFSRFGDDMADLMSRISNVETGQSLIRQELSLQTTQITHLTHRMDRFDEPMTRIERRLDLIEV